MTICDNIGKVKTNDIPGLEIIFDIASLKETYCNYIIYNERGREKFLGKIFNICEIENGMIEIILISNDSKTKKIKGRYYATRDEMGIYLPNVKIE